MTVKVITICEKVLVANEVKAKQNKARLDKGRILTVNIMSSPGAGKTSLILSTLKHFKDKTRMAVIEGDVASSVDADKVNALGVPVVQINTAGGCHLDANMVAEALDDLPLETTDVLFIENVGNLICPNNYILGEDRRVMIASMPEGHDKPFKYPAMFADTDVVLVNKTDLQPYLNFNTRIFNKTVTALNPDVLILPISCKTRAGLKAWFGWLENALKEKRGR